MGNLPYGLIKSLAFSGAAFVAFWISFASSIIINHHYFEDNLRRVAYHIAKPYGPLQCGLLCSLEGRCKSINYHMKSLTCELVETSASVSDSEGWVSTSDLSFVNKKLGSCANVSITQVNLCIRLRNGGNANMAKYCPVPPSVPHGSVLSVKRNVGDIIRYICDMCYNRNGSPTVKCLSDGQWSPVAMQCYYSTIGYVKLVGGNQSAGTVQILRNGQWGTVCDDGWDNLEATVVCRQLGYSGGKYTADAYFGQGSGPIWMSDMTCSGNECKLSDCSFNDYISCIHAEDAGVICIDN